MSEEGTEVEAPTTRRRTSKPIVKDDGSVGQEEIPELEGPQVRYVGTANRRILAPEDWERVGVDDTDHKTYIWEISNSKSLPKKGFSPKQLDYLRVDGRFEIDEEG